MTTAVHQRWKSLVVWVARWIVAGVFIYAAIPKLIDPAGFATDIANYQVPHWLWNFGAATVPMLELTAALVLLHPRHYRSGAWVLLGLTLIFLVLIYSVIARGIDIECGCFGASEVASNVGWDLFLRDVALLLGIGVASRSASFFNPRKT